MWAPNYYSYHSIQLENTPIVKMHLDSSTQLTPPYINYHTRVSERMIFLRMLSIETVNAMGILANAPQGFSSAVSAINSLPQGILAEMVRHVRE